MKKTLLFVIPLLIAVSACGGNSNSTSSGSSEYVPVITEDTEIDFWSITGKSTVDAVNALIEKFQELEPHVKVTHTVQTGSYNDLQDMTIKGFNSGTYPDMVVAYPDHVADYLYYDKAVDLQPYFDNADYGLSEADKADYIASFMDEGKHYALDGIYSVPWCKSTEAMFYNNVLIGVNLADYDKTINGGKAIDAKYLDNLTWEELFDKLCPALDLYNNANSKVLYDTSKGGAIFGYDSDDNLFITLAEQYGYGYTSISGNGTGSVDFDNDGMKGMMTKFHKAAEKGYLLTKGTNGGDYINTGFNNNQFLFSVGSTGGYTYQFSSNNPMDIGVASIPSPSGKDEKVILQGPSITVLDHGSENRKLASYLLWKYMTNEEGAARWSLSSGYMGVRNSVYTSAGYDEAADESKFDPKTADILKARTMMYCGRDEILGSTFTSPVFVGSSACRTAAGALTTACLKKENWGKTDAEFEKILNDEFTAAKNAAVNGIK